MAFCLAETPQINTRMSYCSRGTVTFRTSLETRTPEALVVGSFNAAASATALDTKLFEQVAWRMFGSLLKTDERRSSVTLWDRSAQSLTPQKSHLPGKSRWCPTPLASFPIGTVYFDGKPNRFSSLIRRHGNFWAGSGLTAIK
jgi:hypothetical protein